MFLAYMAFSRLVAGVPRRPTAINMHQSDNVAGGISPGVDSGRQLFSKHHALAIYEAS